MVRNESVALLIMWWYLILRETIGKGNRTKAYKTFAFQKLLDDKVLISEESMDRDTFTSKNNEYKRETSNGGNGATARSANPRPRSEYSYRWINEWPEWGQPVRTYQMSAFTCEMLTP